MPRSTFRIAIVAICALTLAGFAVPSAATASGTGAVEHLAPCDDNVLAFGDDVVSDEFQLGYDLSFGNKDYHSLRVDTNGKVWLGGTTPPSNASTINPTFSTLTYATIAPFASDVSTEGGAAGTVTYGLGIDGTFCAIWNQVGYYLGGVTHTETTNTFQLVITPASELPGRAEGDFDVTFNYDSIGWDRGGRASAGWSSGDQVEWNALAGSAIDTTMPGRLIDDGPDALTTGGTGSSTWGRNIFSITNAIGKNHKGNLVSNAPYVTGSATVGSTLTPHAPIWGPAPVEMTYAWLRDDLLAQDFGLLPYVVKPTDVGHTIAFVAIGYKTNYIEQLRASEYFVIPAPIVTTVAPPAPAVSVPDATAALTASVPTISGTAKLGKKLTVRPGTWTAGAVLSYRWYANGKAIKKATHSTLRLAASVGGLKISGKKITVIVTGAKAGYPTTSKTSKATKAVKK